MARRLGAVQHWSRADAGVPARGGLVQRRGCGASGAACRTANELRRNESLPHALSRLARAFKVSNLVILRRLFDANWLDRARFDAAWAEEGARLRTLAQRGSDGGDFYRTTLSRVSRRFARALVVSTLEGQTLYRDAFRMLGVSRTETFNHFGREIGVVR